MVSVTKKKTALITGISGQDGYYLAELLVKNHYRVVGTVRDIGHVCGNGSAEWLSDIQLVEWNLRDEKALSEILISYRPDEFYNLAAASSGIAMYDHPVTNGKVNGIAVTGMLESIKNSGLCTRFLQASSSEIYGNSAFSPQDEETPAIPRSPYGAAKLYAHSMTRLYREHYGMYTCSAILFNHESPRRGVGFVSGKITDGAARIKLGLADRLLVGNLDARRDWGFAGDYMVAAWLMLQQEKGDDYVVATGEAHSVRELCSIAFGYFDLDYEDYVSVDPAVYRPDEKVRLVGNASKAKTRLGWSPKLSFRQLVEMMAESDIQRLRKLM